MSNAGRYGVSCGDARDRRLGDDDRDAPGRSASAACRHESSRPAGSSSRRGTGCAARRSPCRRRAPDGPERRPRSARGAAPAPSAARPAAAGSPRRRARASARSPCAAAASSSARCSASCASTAARLQSRAARANVRDAGGGDLREPVAAVPRLRAGRRPVRQDDGELRRPRLRRPERSSRRALQDRRHARRDAEPRHADRRLARDARSDRDGGEIRPEAARMEAVRPVQLDPAIRAQDVLPGEPRRQEQRAVVARGRAIRVDDGVEGGRRASSPARP